MHMYVCMYVCMRVCMRMYVCNHDNRKALVLSLSLEERRQTRFPSSAQFQPKRQPFHAVNMIQRMQITSAVFFTVLRGRL